MATAAREKYYIKNTLLCLLKAVEGKVTTVELRNENTVTGMVDHVDGYMNISMSNVCFKSYKSHMTNFESFFVKGENVRFVQIPDEIDMKKSIERYIWKDRHAEDTVRKRIRDAAWKKITKRQEQAKKAERLEEKQKQLEEEKSKQKDTDKT